MKISASIHIVRKYGPYGGMERYVWELTHALAEQGNKVKVVCEQSMRTENTNIEIIELGIISQKPRWISMLRFSKRVSAYLNKTDITGWVVHSHERTAKHQVTTFHGPSILSRKKRALDFLSPRIATWEYLEKREILNEKVQVVLPNSKLVANTLAQLYPSAAHKLGFPAYPGVSETFYNLAASRKGRTIGFIGKEWQRKGLIFAIEVLKPLIEKDPTIKFIVVGPAPESISHLFSEWSNTNYELKGWKRSEDLLKEIDLLIHPAKVEPFGMVVAEANAAGIPVVISNQCGIAELINENHGKALPLDNMTNWREEIKNQLQNNNIKPLELTWKSLSTQHHQLYLKIDTGS